MNIIGIAGYKRSGKNEVGRIMAETLGPTAGCVAFADKLKIAAARSLGFSRSDADLIALMDAFKEAANINIDYVDPLNDMAVTAHDLTGRAYLQWFGTEGGRHTYGDSFWIDQVLNAEYPGVQTLLVTDVRFPNEMEAIRYRGGKLIKVKRPGCDGGLHGSEQYLPDELFDHVIYNTGTLEELEGKAQRALL